uniref:Uncharacterized protein n=2 Tax=Eptatretus burgeri TaxID=7764 RepID=A0A8C4QHA7_EPTBU
MTPGSVCAFVCRKKSEMVHKKIRMVTKMLHIKIRVLLQRCQREFDMSDMPGDEIISVELPVPLASQEQDQDQAVNLLKIVDRDVGIFVQLLRGIRDRLYHSHEPLHKIILIVLRQLQGLRLLARRRKEMLQSAGRVRGRAGGSIKVNARRSRGQLKNLKNRCSIAEMNEFDFRQQACKILQKLVEYLEALHEVLLKPI